MRLKTTVEVDDVYEQSELYYRFVESILDKQPVVRTQQLYNSLNNTFPVCARNKRIAWGILKDMQKERETLVMTDDGFTLNYDVLRVFYRPQEMSYIFQRTKRNWIHSFKPKYEQLTQAQKNMIDSFAVVASLMPESEDFTGSSSMWDFVFTIDRTDEREDRIYEIVKISKDDEDVKCELLKLLSPIEDEEIQRKTIRVAILDDPNSAYKIPKVGFVLILQKVDDTINEQGWELVQERDFNDAWSEQETFKAMRKKYMSEQWKKAHPE